MLRYLPAIIIALFFIELAGLIWLGGQIGVLTVIGLTALGFVIGGLLIRRSGTNIFRLMNNGQLNKSDISRGAAGGLLDVAAGVLFAVPGIITDVLALGLLLPVVRRWLADFLTSRFTGSFSVHQPYSQKSGPIIEAEAVDTDAPPGSNADMLPKD